MAQITFDDLQKAVESLNNGQFNEMLRFGFRLNPSNYSVKAFVQWVISNYLREELLVQLHQYEVTRPWLHLSPTVWSDVKVKKCSGKN